MHDIVGFLNQSVTKYQSIELVQAALEAAGAVWVQESQSWPTAPGSLCYVVRDSSALIAWRIGLGPPLAGWRLAAAHVDSPGLRLRPFSAQAAGSLLQMGTEVYGAPILTTWLDQDLGIAGSAVFRTDLATPLSQKSFHLNQVRAVIPNAAIHLNREINKGFEYNPQQHLKAYLGLKHSTDTGVDQALRLAIANNLGLSASAIVAYEAWLCDDKPAAFLDPEAQFLHGPRLDNLLGCQAVVQAFLTSANKPWGQMAILYDHEEIGSRSNLGADGAFLAETLDRLAANQGLCVEDRRRTKAGSFLLSVDVAHALNPSYADKYDSAAAPRLGDGLVVKTNINHAYAGTLSAVAKALDLWNRQAVPVQFFANRADMPSGSTIGPISESWLGMPTIDIGVGIWAMHSRRELCAIADQNTIIRAIALIYGEPL